MMRKKFTIKFQKFKRNYRYRVQGYKCVSHGKIMYNFQKIKYVNLPCLFSVVLCACLGETTISSVS